MLEGHLSTLYSYHTVCMPFILRWTSCQGTFSPVSLPSPPFQGVVLFSRDNRELDLLLFWEVCDFVSRVDRVLSRPGGSMLLAGRSGVGRRSATCLVAHMHGYTLYTPKISRGYALKQFSNDLKAVSLQQPPRSALARICFVFVAPPCR